MIEIVYKEDGKETGEGRILDLPKNVRQIGEPEDARKIYIEDYVVTYLRRFAKERVLSGGAAILLGNVEKMEGIPYIFIKSAIALKGLEITLEHIPFTDEVWAQVYGTMKEYFAGQDICGWFLCTPGYPLELEGTLTKIHVNYFGGVDKVLMISEPLDSEEDFYAYENGRLTRQRGYHIFYERNADMQRYMVETGDGESIDDKEDFEDRAIQSFRAIVQEKRELSGQKRVMTFLYTASTFLVMVVLVIGITLINNYEKMEKLELALQDISQSLEVKTAEAFVQSEVGIQPLEESVQEKELSLEETVVQEKGETLEEEKQPEESLEEASPVSGQTAEIPEIYIVQKGDTLLGISRKFYGSDDLIKEICRLNNIYNRDRIMAGEKLLLP